MPGFFVVTVFWQFFHLTFYLFVRYPGSSARGVGILKHLLDQPASQYWPPQEEFELVHQVTNEELEAKLTKFLSIKDYTDVLIYFSGHGCQYFDQDDDKNKGYLATSNSRISIDQQGTLPQKGTSLAFTRIAILLEKAKHLKSLVLLIDACHSGHAITEETLQATLLALYLASGKKSDSDRFSFCIIPSSLSYEESWIEGELGVFTKTLIDVLENKEHGSITAEGLSNAIKSGLKSRNQQTIKSAHSGSILLMDYPSKGQQKPAQDPIYADPPHNTEIKNPYQGLEAFDQNSHEFFFGREVVVEQIINQLKETDFVPVIGVSGSGKSSVIKAGVFPRLAENDQWVMMEMKPGETPLTILAETLRGSFSSALEASDTPTILGSFARKPTKEKFIQLLEQLPPNKKFLLLIDQFEETFTLTNQIDDSTEREEVLQDQKSFIDILTATRKPLYVVITMRADFLAPCLDFTALHNLIQNHAIYMPPLRGQALLDVIQKPAERQGFEVDQDLVNELEQEVANEPGSLPL